jgi:hypothetical protein
MTPYPPYTPQGPRMHPLPPQKYWYEGPPRRGPPPGGPYGGPPPYMSSYEGPETRPPMRSGYGEGRPYGPPPPEYYPPRHEGYPPPPPSFRTPQRGSAALVQTSSFSSSSKEETPEAFPPHKNSDWEPTRSTAMQKKDPKKQGGDPLSFLAKVAMAPQDEAKVTTHIAPSSDDSPSRLRSSPIITPNSVPQREPPPPPAQYYREPSALPHRHSATPKPITPTTTHYGPRPYDDVRGSGPYYSTPHPPSSSQYPPSYPSGYDSRAASWEQPAVVVEERNSFDSLESAGAGAPYPRPPWGSPYAQPPPLQWYNPAPPYESPPYPGRMMPPVVHRGGYYDDRAYRGPPYGGVPPPPPRDEKTVLRKKFSWKHFPEVRGCSLCLCEHHVCSCVCYIHPY